MPEAIHTTYVRTAGQALDIRRFGPKPEARGACLACGEDFAVGDSTTLVALGPGGDDEEREKCARGRAYNATAVEIHWACATGETDAA